MADERKCYAGDLGSDALGKTILTGVESGTVIGIRHELDEGRKVTRIALQFYGEIVTADTDLVTVRP